MHKEFIEFEKNLKTVKEIIEVNMEKELEAETESEAKGNIQEDEEDGAWGGKVIQASNTLNNKKIEEIGNFDRKTSYSFEKEQEIFQNLKFWRTNMRVIMKGNTEEREKEKKEWK